MRKAMTLAQIRSAIKDGPDAEEVDRLLALLTARSRSAQEAVLVDQLLELKYRHMAMALDPFEDAEASAE